MGIEKTLSGYTKNKYAKLTKKINELIGSIDKYTIEFLENDIDEHIISVHNNKNLKILSAKCEIIGSYDTQCELFTWAWGMQLRNVTVTDFEKNIKKYIKKVKYYIENTTYNDLQYLEQILYYLSNNIIYITPDNLEIIKNLCVVACDGNGVLQQFKNSEKTVYIYYLVTDIIGT
jgi:hypothetical protein